MVVILADGIWDEFAVGFGVTAAVLAVGGLILLRFQRNRHQYALMHAALEKGVSFMSQQPAWLVSLRQGLLTLTLGLALCGVGAVAWAMANPVDLPNLSTTRPSADYLIAPKPRDEEGKLKPEGRLYAIVKSEWERAQTQRTVGMALVGSGVVLVLLGAVRMAFARAEKAVIEQSELPGI